jgi:hypothetical protein
MKEFLYKCGIGIAAMVDVFVMLYIASPIDSLFKLLLYSVAAYLVAMYFALYTRSKKIEPKAIGCDFYETTGA